MEDLEETIQELEAELLVSQDMFEQLRMRNVRLRNLLHRNCSYGPNPEFDHVAMPFAIIKCPPEADVDIHCLQPKYALNLGPNSV
jgi:hypothetical protein